MRAQVTDHGLDAKSVMASMVKLAQFAQYERDQKAKSLENQEEELVPSTHTRTHAHTHTQTHARAHTHAHAHKEHTHPQTQDTYTRHTHTRARTTHACERKEIQLDSV